MFIAVQIVKKWRQPRFPSTSECTMVHPGGRLPLRGKREWLLVCATPWVSLTGERCWGKEAPLKTLSTTWFYVYNILEKAKPEQRRIVSASPRSQMGEERATKGHTGDLGKWQSGSGSPSQWRLHCLYMCQISQNCNLNTLSVNICIFVFTFKYFIYLFIYLFLERGEGREEEKERNVDVREKHGSVASRTHPAGTEPAPQANALTGNQTGDLSLCGTTPNPLSHSGQAVSWFLKQSEVKILQETESASHRQGEYCHEAYQRLLSGKYGAFLEITGERWMSPTKPRRLEQPFHKKLSKWLIGY